MKLITKHICLKNQLGVHNNLFGGTMLSWIDEAGAIFVSELLKTNMIVTVHMGDATFKNPIKEGNIVHLYGNVKKIGNTSITISINAVKIDVSTQTTTIMFETEMTFVQVDHNGKSISIPDDIKQTLKNIYNI